MNVSLNGKRKLLPTNDYGCVINQYEQYTKERKACSTIRLTCQVNPICSNVLFNDITEVVKYEGSDYVSVLNYGIGKNLSNDLNNVIGKNSKSIGFWTNENNQYGSFVDGNNYFINAIRDTQLSNDKCGFVYHCGLDILNNHLIRTTSFKTVCDIQSKDDSFNTLGDYMRTVDGEKVQDVVYYPEGISDTNEKQIDYHLYQYDDILSFKNTISTKLIQKHNGWVGFVNTAKLKTYEKDFASSTILSIERPIMYKNGGDFIDMYPGRDLYSFVPKYNSYKKRVEKNWEYCITYPSSSTTLGLESVIETNDNINALKAIYFDENTSSDNGTKQIVIYSIVKHGLKSGDYVNIYKTYGTTNSSAKTTEKVMNSVEVMDVVDDYIFTISNSSMQISDNWVYLSSEDLEKSKLVIGNKTYILDSASKQFYYQESEPSVKYYIVNSNYVNLDKASLNISYKKVVSDIECEYYARIFSRLPNFKWASEDTSSEYQIYKENEKVLNEYKGYKYSFENHVSRLAFAKNIYSDDIGEIVYTDNIDIANLHDNLGRPLTSLYITFFKNNRGYKEWYGYDYPNWSENTITDDNENIEFSHCFGNLTCGIECCDEAKYESNIPNIHKLTSDSIVALDIENINGENRKYSNNCDADKYEIIYWSDKNFYGDICCYDNYNALETTLQPIMHRFNTAQRESKNKNFANFGYDEITSDDYDVGGTYTINTTKFDDVSNNKREGYYYKASYEIPIKSFGVLESAMPDMLDIKKITPTEITTLSYHYLTIGDKAMMYDTKKDKYYTLITVKGNNDNYRTFSYKAYDEDGNQVVDLAFDKENLKLFKLDNLDIPSYAKLLKDGTCRYIWREIINNGMDSHEMVETYPFTNGAFYINKRIDIYVRRQDPYDEYGLYDGTDIPGNKLDDTSQNNYVTDEEITC